MEDFAGLYYEQQGTHNETGPNIYVDMNSVDCIYWNRYQAFK